METRHLMLFSRAPVAGESKTRLAAAIGAEAARAFHVCCLKDAIEILTAYERHGAGMARVRCHVFITPPCSEGLFAEAGVNWPESFSVHEQEGRDLGARMAAAFAAVLGPGHGNERALILGSDLPLLHRDFLDQAFSALQEAEVVFAPAEDGGYSLVGLRQVHGELFDSVPWGGEGVLARSLGLARAMGLTAACIESLPDVDTLDDVARVRAHPRYDSEQGGRALGFLRRLAQS